MSMVKGLAQKNLFGERIAKPRPQFEAALERADKRQNPFRAARVRWLKGVIPKNISYVLPVETALVFEEAKSCFVYGHFIATIILAASFIEHWLISSLQSGGHCKEASRGLAAAIKFARSTHLVDPVVLDQADHLRLIRNPFVHLKEFDHEHTITQRAGKYKTDPWTLSEKDAKEALIAMYAVAKHAFG
jgi:hypothetical protein